MRQRDAVDDRRQQPRDHRHGADGEHGRHGNSTTAFSASLSGGTNSAGGTITLKVFGPQAAAPATCTSGGTTVGTVPAGGNGRYRFSSGFTPSSPGNYWWYATYSGDSKNAAATSTCGSGMSGTTVYSVTSVASATDTSGASSTTSSFTVQPNTTYLLVAFRNSQNGDGLSSITSSGLNPALSTASFTSVAQQNFHNLDYQSVYYVTTGSGASGTGTLTVTFKKALGAGQVTILDLIAVGGNNTASPIVTTNERLTFGNVTTATAGMPSVPASNDASLVFLVADQDLGASAPAASPAMTNPFYSDQASGSAGVYAAAPAQQSEGFPVGSGRNWGTIALEISHG